MADKRMVTTFDNQQVELVFNENLICPWQDEGILDMNLGPDVNNWKMRLIFDPKPGTVAFAMKWEYNVDGFHIRTTCSNWKSSSGEIRLAKPFTVSTKDGSNKFYFSLSSKCIAGSGQLRTIQITVWKAI